jgi:lipopolysaccharide/colanic/teichoic acid biosynthesis glycosyltransferase
MKRLFDLAVAATGLALTLPVLLLVGLAVKLDSPGPVLFRQQRVGRHGRPFELLKFRTMVDSGDCTGPLVTAAGDRRVTRVGRLLRASKIDEVPQLWNVIRGQMSLVGPRPEVARYVALYPAGVATKVLSVRPGMTDEASIRFRNESEILARAEDPERAYVERVLPQKLALYQQYVERHSVIGDLGILLRTLYVVLTGRTKSTDS